MMAVEKRWDAEGGDANIGLGFVPDLAILFENANGTNPDIYFYSKQLYDTESMTGIVITGSSGVVTRKTTAATGMIPLSTVVERVEVPAPNGDGYAKATVTDWASGTTYSTARSTTVTGTVVRPPTHNGRVFECTTASGAGTSEPSSWAVNPGASVTDGGGNVFICREERVCRDGAQGLTVGSSIQTDGQHCVLWAFKCRDSKNAGDAASVVTGGIV